jgi:hypothetical protein
MERPTCSVNSFFICKDSLIFRGFALDCYNCSFFWEIKEFILASESPTVAISNSSSSWKSFWTLFTLLSSLESSKKLTSIGAPVLLDFVGVSEGFAELSSSPSLI